jgi:uncharacterized membrane protein YciS (DUF1049 family)
MFSAWPPSGMFRVITINMIIIISLIFFIFIFCIALLWILVPAFYGLPSVPTKPERIRKALKLVNLQPDEVLYDLGAGDGRVLLIAAREFGAFSIGLEVGPVQCALIWLRIASSGLSHRIKIQWGNFFKADLKEADVVYVYATSQEVLKLAPFLQRQMKAGSRVVSISADFPEWEPSTFDERDLIFVYEMPPESGSLMSYLLKEAKE